MEKVEQFIKQYDMAGAGDKIITGVSGGADSVCLLFMLCALRKKLGFTLAVCHVNHGLRGEAADRDEKYVEEICRRLDIPCRVFHENVELISRKRKQSLEEAGRQARREAFETMCRENGGTKIAAAHHRDDNAETVLMNIARGTGIRGLCGIRPVQGKWIRPLLCLSREETEGWLERKNIPYCTDDTNHDDEYTRNRIRHHIIPALREQVNQGAALHLDSLSFQAREIWEYLEAGADEAWKRCVTEEASEDGKIRILINAEKIGKTPAAVRKLLIHRCICRTAGREKDIQAVHVRDVLELFEKQPGRSVRLPYRVEAVRVYEGVAFSRRSEEADCVPAGESPEEFSLELKIPGETVIPGTGRKICCVILGPEAAFSAKEIPQKSYTKCFDYDIIKHGLSARYRRPGDYLVIDGNGRRQKLKAFFINEKVPADERGRKLLIADGDHIIWIPGMRMSRAYQTGEQTKRILRIQITEE